MLRETREQILHSLNSVPQTVDFVEHARETFVTDKPLQDKTIDLYISILCAVDGLVAYLVNDSVLGKIGNVLLKGPEFERHLVKLIHDIDTYNKRVLARIKILRNRFIARTDAGVRRLGARLSQQDLTLSKIEDGQKNMYYLVRSFMADLLRSVPWRPSQEEIMRTLREATSNGPRAAINGTELILLLGFSDRESGESETGLLSHGNMAGKRDPKFQKWLSTRPSEVLLVQDNIFSTEYGRITTMSALCASLSRSLREDYGVISMQFFCGQHAAPDDSLYGPVRLLRCLIKQLICTSGYDFDLSILNPPRQRKAIEEGDLQMLCNLFRELVYQLPPDTMLFCSIDGLSFLEKRPYQHQVSTVMHTLVQLTRDLDLNSIFKLLVTDRAQVDHNRYNIRPAECLLLSRHVDFEGYDLTEREVMAQLQRSMNPMYALPDQSDSDSSDSWPDAEDYNTEDGRWKHEMND